MAICHKDNKITEILTLAVNFPSWELFYLFSSSIPKKLLSLCVHTLLSYSNIELYFENCPWPWFIWDCPWFMPIPREPGAILKCKLLLVPAGLFQDLVIQSSQSLWLSLKGEHLSKWRLSVWKVKRRCYLKVLDQITENKFCLNFKIRSDFI